MRTRFLVGVVTVLAIVVFATVYAITNSNRTRQGTTPPSGTITGRVLSLDGEPVAGASVYALGNNSMTGRLPIFLTDEKGEFVIQGLIPGTYKMSASKEADGYPPTDNTFYSAGTVQLPEVTINEGETIPDVPVYLGPQAARLHGHLINAASAKPIKNLQDVQVILRRADNPDLSYMIGPDTEGQYSALVPSNILFTIEVSAPGYERRHVEAQQLNPKAGKLVDIPLRPVKTGRN